MIAKYLAERLYKQLDKLHYGTIILTTPDGRTREFTSNDPSGLKAHITLHHWSVIPNLLMKGDVGFAEDYRDNKWETDNLLALLTIALKNRAPFDNFVLGKKLFRLIGNLGYFTRRNSLKGSRRNIEEHYDLGNKFYSLWLDQTMTYSSALYDGWDQPLNSAQTNKYDRIINRLGRHDGKLLEIGCGWGGFMEHAMTRGDYHIKGLTLSPSQRNYALDRLPASRNSQIALTDYRHEDGRYDNIVSIEMLEAVGEKYWPTYFSKLARLLNRNGRAIIQTITINEMDFDRYRKGSDFIRTYIFPGGMLPSTSRFVLEAQKAGLSVERPFHFAPHYARTLEQWLTNFERCRPSLNSLGFDEPFIRLWRFYLAACSAGFATGRTDVIQATLKHQT